MSQLAQNRGTLSNQNICRDTNVLIWKSTPVCASCDIIFVNRKLVFHRLDFFFNENAYDVVPLYCILPWDRIDPLDQRTN